MITSIAANRPIAEGLSGIIPHDEASKYLFIRAGLTIRESTPTPYVQELIEKVKSILGRRMEVTVNSPKYSFSPNLLESDIDLRYIQVTRNARHKSSKTTGIYAHVSKTKIANIKSPLVTVFKE